MRYALCWRKKFGAKNPAQCDPFPEKVRSFPFRSAGPRCTGLFLFENELVEDQTWVRQPGPVPSPWGHATPKTTRSLEPQRATMPPVTDVTRSGDDLPERSSNFRPTGFWGKEEPLQQEGGLETEPREKSRERQLHARASKRMVRGESFALISPVTSKKAFSSLRVLHERKIVYLDNYRL